MKKLNKFFAVVVSVILCAFAFTACNKAPVIDGGDDLPDPIPSAAYTMSFKYTSGGEAVAGDINKFVNEQFKLTCAFSGNITDKQQDKTAWKSSDGSVVALTVTGGTGKTAQITAKKAGEAIVTATGYDGTVFTSVKIIVSDFVISSTVEKLEFCLEEGVVPAIVDYTLSEAREVSFESSNKSVATVSETGLVTPVGAGEAKITVTEPKSKAKLTISVTVTQKVVTPVVNAIDLLFNAEVKDNYAEPLFKSKYGNLTYSSDNLGVATVDASGAVTAAGLGSAVITATVTVNGKTYTGEVTVNVVSERKSEYAVLNDTDETYVNFYGRTYYDSAKKSVMFPYGAAGFEVKFYGTALYANMSAVINGAYSPWVQVLVDGENVPDDDLQAKKFNLTKTTDNEVTLVSGLTEGVHTVKVLKRSAYARGTTLMDEAGLKSVKTNNGGYILSPDKKPELKIDLYGDSISCAYGNLAETYNEGGMTSKNTNALLGYHYLAAQELGAQINIQAHSGWGVYVNTSGTTDWGQWYNNFEKLAYGKTAKWDFSRYQADVVVVNLGTNDSTGVGGAYNSADFIKYYKQMIDGLIAKYGTDVKVVLCYGMMGTNATVGADITSVANSYGNNVKYLNFTNYGTISGTYATGHPSQAAHKQSGADLAKFISDMLA